MRKVKVGDYTIELDEKFVEKYEKVTCGRIDDFAETYVRLGFDSSNISEITSTHSLEEVTSMVLQYINAELSLYK